MTLPWNHKIQIEGRNLIQEMLDDPNVADETKQAGVVVVKCTCGEFEFAMTGGIDIGDILDRSEGHMETHPMPPLARWRNPDGTEALVMAVPGYARSGSVHMTVSIPKGATDEDITRQLGTLGSPAHFEAEARRKAQGNEEAPFGIEMGSEPHINVHMYRMDRDGSMTDMGHFAPRRDGKDFQFLPVPEGVMNGFLKKIRDDIAMMKSAEAGAGGSASISFADRKGADDGNPARGGIVD